LQVPGALPDDRHRREDARAVSLHERLPVWPLLSVAIMSCRHFMPGRLCRCTAVEGLMIPSLYERERFCTRSPDRCPTYRSSQRRGGPISEEEYYTLWLAPRAPAP